MQFIKFTFATFCGILLFFALGLVALLVLASAIDSSADSATKIDSNSWLRLNLNTQISEMGEENPLEELGLLIGEGQTQLGVIEILAAIKAAKTDDHIKGIYIEATMPQTGYAVLYEIRQALEDFKESKKPIYAYSEFYTENAYFIASVADSIWVNPVGGVEFNGLSVEKTYLKNMFEKIGVKPEIFKVGDFKSAVEPFFRSDMSEEDRLQTLTYLNSLYNLYLKEVAKSRNINIDSLKQISNKMLVQNVGDAVRYGLVTDSLYLDQVQAALRKVANLEEKDKIKFTGIKNYIKSDFVQKMTKSSKNKIAVIVAEGNIVSGKGGEESVGSDKFAEEIRKARKDDKVKAIVLRINSPGGSALASDVMWREIMLAKKEKPVIASMSNVAASGGYYMAMGCNKIIAQPNTITGSIGVFGVLFDAQNMLNDKLGLTFDRVNTGEYAGIGMPTKAISDAERQVIQRGVEDIYKGFTAKAASGRNMNIDSLKKVASGRVWTGEDAQRIGLVDELGGLDKAIQVAATAAKLAEGDYAIKYMPKKKKFLDKLMETTQNEIRISNLKAELGVFYPYYQMLKKLQTNEGIQARLPFELVIK